MSKIKSMVGGVCVGFVCAVTPRCREITRLISQDRDRPVDALTAARMKLHYKVCVWCERYRDQVNLIGELSKSFPEVEHDLPCLSEETRQRIEAAVKNASV